MLPVRLHNFHVHQHVRAPVEPGEFSDAHWAQNFQIGGVFE
jgi:hypothetical protein